MPKGWREYPMPGMPDVTVYEKGSLRCLVSRPDGYWHLSITAKKRWPAYVEMKEARYDLIPHDCNMAMIFPRPEEFINLHSGCFHLHELRPGEVKPYAEGMPKLPPRLRSVTQDDMQGKAYRHFLIAGEDNTPYRVGDVLKIGDFHYEITE